jgi:hypothetical protein
VKDTYPWLASSSPKSTHASCPPKFDAESGGAYWLLPGTYLPNYSTTGPASCTSSQHSSTSPSCLSPIPCRCTHIESRPGPLAAKTDTVSRAVAAVSSPCCFVGTPLAHQHLSSPESTAYTATYHVHDNNRQASHWIRTPRGS